ncbi:MAG: HDOD domain-containing protein [Pseudomonadales bacterium]|nr:HDOD domain-containing protein [Pseudomonadales bacterium]
MGNSLEKFEKPLSAGSLKRLLSAHPFFEDWGDDRWQRIAPHCRLLELPASAELLAEGDLSPYAHFLLDGAVCLKPSQGAQRRLGAGDLDSRFPFARLRPSRYQVTAEPGARVLKIESSRMQRQAGKVQPARFLTNGRTTGGSWRAHPLVRDVLRRLETGTLDIPPLPAIALKIRKALSREDFEMAEIAAIVGADPAIAGRLIQVANSAIFRAQSHCETVQAALVRLGVERTQNIVLSLATGMLFRATESGLRRHLVERWRHAIDVAALCAVLAKITPGLNSDKGMLVGLLHEVGSVPVLHAAREYAEFAQNPGILMEIVEGLTPEVSPRVLAHWQFADVFSAAAAQQDNWFYEHEGPADYSDLLIVAHLHALIRQREFRKLPRLDETPAFGKLALGALSPSLSLQVLDEAHEQIQELKSLLN